MAHSPEDFDQILGKAFLPKLAKLVFGRLQDFRRGNVVESDKFIELPTHSHDDTIPVVPHFGEW